MSMSADILTITVARQAVRIEQQQEIIDVLRDKVVAQDKLLKERDADTAKEAQDGTT